MPSPVIFSSSARRLAFAILSSSALIAPSAHAAQDTTQSAPASSAALSGPDDPLAATDTITAQATMPDSDSPVPVDKACVEAARASNGGHMGTIVACFHSNSTSQRVETSKSQDLSTRDGAARPPDVSSLPGCMGPCITIPFGKVPEPVYYIDLAALPEAPAGSDAWKIGKGTKRAP